MTLVEMLELEARKKENMPGSETTKCRDRLAPYCVGAGVDLGCGRDPITAEAIRIDFKRFPYRPEKFNIQICGDATKLVWFQDGVLDFVYSSHLLEDFQDTEKVLREWLRVLKVGGKLIIYCPDQARYMKYCKDNKKQHNTAHKHANFSLDFVKNKLHNIGKTRVVYEQDNVEIYSWELVVEKFTDWEA